MLTSVVIAAACSGESAEGGTPTTNVAVGGTTQTTEAADATTPASPSIETIVDPRGDLFTEFQAGFDRSHPFQPLDTFCHRHDEAADRQATEPGIDADSIQVHHIRQELENLIDIGFGVDVGDPTHMFDTLIGVINEQCGGIRGRTIELSHTSYDPLSPDIDQVRIGACVSATEDHHAAFVMSSMGLQGSATLCVAEDHNTAMITTLGVEEAFLARGGGNLVTLDFSLDDSLRHMVQRLDAAGALEGAVIGVVGGDTPGDPESVESGLIDTSPRPATT